MERRKQSRGKCSFCGYESTKAAMTKHLVTCPQRQQEIARSEQGAGKSEALYHLRVMDKYSRDFWLDLEMRGSATLNKLDEYLRAIWLECCGHMSRFSYGGWGDEISMSRKVQDVLHPGVELTHVYDFGTSSETRITSVAMREGKPLTKNPIVLMSRNLLPEETCMECEKPAEWLCMECIIEDEKSGWLCDAHLKKHPHGDNYGEPIPFVNSPRLGMCGYDGPATPPY